MIYIVRHGQTDWNLEGRCQGRTNIGINKNGIKEACDIKEKLKGVPFDKIFSSPLARACETAEILTNGAVSLDKRLIERNNGQLEGKTKAEYNGAPNFNDPEETRYGIEPYLKFRKRIYDFLDEIIKNYPKQNILVVTHAGVSIYIKCYFEGEPKDGNYKSYKLKNCEILKYEN